MTLVCSGVYWYKVTDPTPIKLCDILVPPIPPPPHWWLIGSKCSIVPSLYSVGDDQNPLFPPENHEIPPPQKKILW